MLLGYIGSSSVTMRRTDLVLVCNSGLPVCRNQSFIAVDVLSAR